MQPFLPWARAAAVVGIGIGVLVLVGWLFDVTALKRMAPGLLPMKANTAAMLIATGLGLWWIAGERPSALGRRATAVAGTFVALVAALTLVEYAWRDLGIDQLVFHDTQPGYPGRPAPHTAVAFVFVGANLVLLCARGAARRAAPWANAAAAATVSLAVLGYAFGVDYLRGLTSGTGIALPTLAGLVVVVLGLALVQPSAGWIGVFTAPGPGGRMARTFAPLVVFAPVLMGVEHRFFDSTLGRAAAAAVVTGLAIALLLRAAAALEHTEIERVTLAGLLPICAHCKSIRDDGGYWTALETYIESHSEAYFSHGLCSKCVAEHYPQFADEIEEKQRQASI